MKTAVWIWDTGSPNKRPKEEAFLVPLTVSLLPLVSKEGLEWNNISCFNFELFWQLRSELLPRCTDKKGWIIQFFSFFYFFLYFHNFSFPVPALFPASPPLEVKTLFPCWITVFKLRVWCHLLAKPWDCQKNSRIWGQLGVSRTHGLHSWWLIAWLYFGEIIFGFL